MFLLTLNLELVRDEALGDVGADLDGLPRHDPLLCTSTSLVGAVVDEGVDPLRMLADDGAPEEVTVCTQVARPLVG